MCECATAQPPPYPLTYPQEALTLQTAQFSYLLSVCGCWLRCCPAKMAKTKSPEWVLKILEEMNIDAQLKCNCARSCESQIYRLLFFVTVLRRRLSSSGNSRRTLHCPPGGRHTRCRRVLLTVLLLVVDEQQFFCMFFVCAVLVVKGEVTRLLHLTTT